MKRIFARILIAAMLLMCCMSISVAQSAQHTVYATVAPVFALTEGLLRGIDDFSVSQLVQPQLDCIRLYELSDWDIVQLSSAEICVIWGHGLESFSDTLTQAESGPAVITVSDEANEYSIDSDMSDYDYYEHYSSSNPNSYMSLEYIGNALDTLYDTMCSLYPDYSYRFLSNYERMKGQIDGAVAELKAMSEGTDISIAAALFEGAPYLLDDMNIEWEYIYPREVASDVEGEDLTELLNSLEGSDASFVVIEQQAPTSLKQALTDAGWQVKQLSTLITLSEPTFEEYILHLLGNAEAVMD